MASYDGDTPEDKKLWHTYLYWARQQVKVNLPVAYESEAIADDKENKAYVDDKENRIAHNLANALQAILFSSFALEYRLKRVLVSLGVSFPAKETLGRLLENFWKRLKDVDREDKSGKCAPPTEWANCERLLTSLVKLRNDIAHANYKNTLNLFADNFNPEQLACQYYIAVVDAIKLINIGTGHDTRPLNEIEEYFKPLKVP